jgi:hypothetical protein
VGDSDLSFAYLRIRQELVALGYEAEIDWQRRQSLDLVSESSFLRESAWVILSGGMSERVIRRKFPSISMAFHNWESATVIVQDAKMCRERALRRFRHSGKIGAIIQVAHFVLDEGMGTIKQSLELEGPEYLIQIPYIGPVTCHHLAKNLGVDTVKPDRHLRRLAHNLGYSSPRLMCEHISSSTGEPVSVVDLVLWRFATLKENYVEHFLDLSVA